MAKNLKSYRDRSNPQTAASSAENLKSSNMNGSDMTDIESMVNEYGGKSENELMNELMQMTAKKKRDGSFDPDAMRKTASSIMPMLTPEQQITLNGILSRIGG